MFLKYLTIGCVLLAAIAIVLKGIVIGSGEMSDSDFSIKAAACVLQMAVGLLVVMVTTHITSERVWWRVAYAGVALLMAAEVYEIFAEYELFLLHWPIHIMHVAVQFALLLMLLSLAPTKGASPARPTPSDRSWYWQVLRAMLVFPAAIGTFAFAAFDVAIGMDAFGTGTPVMVTSILAIAGAITAVRYVIRPSLVELRTVSLLLLSTTFAVRFSRGSAYGNLFYEMSVVLLLIAFAPLLVMMVGLMIPTSRRGAVNAGEA